MKAANLGFKGHPPKMKIQNGNPEALKYGKLWDLPEYRRHAPGEHFAGMFLLQAKPHKGAKVIDFGCGTGRGALALSKSNLDVTMIDFVRNSLDSDVRAACGDTLRFLKADLELPIPALGEYGFCTDVMEHIPGMRVDRVLTNILNSAQHVFFAICTKDDEMGELIGERLHLSVHEYGWWLDKFVKQDAVVHWSLRTDAYSFFYVSAWKTGREVVNSGKLNTVEETIRQNVKHNIAQGWQHIHQQYIAEPNEANLEVAILGGGPSLDLYRDDIRAKKENGVKIVTLNGAYNWAYEHDLMPVTQIVVDARPFNCRFTKPVDERCIYLLGSQCDPSVFDGLPKERTWLWHSNPALIGDLLQEYYEQTAAIPGGSSVLLRAIPLLRLLGYKRFHLYGCDSCIMNGAHHAFSQPENDGGVMLPVLLNPGGQTFFCHPWMVSQAQEFMDLIHWAGDEFELEVYGDGLLANILKTGANLIVGEEQGGVEDGGTTMENLCGSEA